MINSGHHPVVPPRSNLGPVIPPSNSGRNELKTPTNASVRGSSVSAAKQERLEALRSERHRIMQMQTTILSRPRSVAGTPQAPVRSPAMGPRANPQPLVFQTHSSVPQDAQGVSNALSYEIDQLKLEISRLKIEVDRYRAVQSKDQSRIKELETELDLISGERDRLQDQHNQDTASRGNDSRRFAEIQDELNMWKDRAANPQSLEKLNQEIKTLRSAISREKDRVFVLMTEKQQLEEQLNDIRTNQFKTDQVESEVASLRVQVSEFGEWKPEKASLLAQVASLQAENDSLTRQLRSEKSQRLVLAARVDELQKYMENADTIIGTYESNVSQRGSLISSIPTTNEADIPTRRNTMESGSFTPTRVVLPGIEPRTVDSLRTPDAIASIDLLPPPVTGGGESKRSAHNGSLQYQPTLVAQPDKTFGDIEERGSAKKLNESSERLGSLFGESDEGFGLEVPAASFVPPPSYSPKDQPPPLVASNSPKNDISDIFGVTSGVDSWATAKPASPAMKYNVHEQAPPIEPYYPPTQQPVNMFAKTPVPVAQVAPSFQQPHVFKQPGQPSHHPVIGTKAPSHSLIRPQTTAVPARGYSPSSSPISTTPQPTMPLHPAFGGNRTHVPSPGPFHTPAPQGGQFVQQSQPVNQFPRPSGFPGSISSVSSTPNNNVNSQGGYNQYPQTQRYGNGPFR